MAPHQPTYQGVQMVSADAVYRDDSGRPHLIFNEPIRGQTRAIQTIPRLDLITRVVALDGEFQTVYDKRIGKHYQRVGRFSIVNEDGRVIYDVFCYYRDEPHLIKKLPPKKKQLGVYWYDIKLGNGALHSSEVEYWVDLILHRAEIVVGHAIDNDIRVFSEGVFKGVETRDTQLYEPYRAYATGPDRKPRLATLAECLLDWDIQGDGHSSVEDAQATLALYWRAEKGIEAAQSGNGVGFGGADEGDDRYFGSDEYYAELEEEPVEEREQAAEPKKDVPQLPLSAAGAFWSTASSSIKTGLLAKPVSAAPAKFIATNVATKQLINTAQNTVDSGIGGIKVATPATAAQVNMNVNVANAKPLPQINMRAREDTTPSPKTESSSPPVAISTAATSPMEQGTNPGSDQSKPATDLVKTAVAAISEANESSKASTHASSGPRKPAQAVKTAPPTGSTADMGGALWSQIATGSKTTQTVTSVRKASAAGTGKIVLVRKGKQ